MTGPQRSGGDGLREERLDAVPELGRLYAQALARMAQTMVGGRPPTTLPAVRYAVEGVRPDARRLGEYQRLVGEPGTDALPAGYVHVLAFPVAVAVMARADFPLPLLGMVHLANSVEQHEQLVLGDRLDVRAWAEGLAAHRSGTQVDLVAEVRRSGSDAVVWRGVSTYLAKGRRVPGVPEAPERERATDAPLPHATGRWKLGREVGRRYAAVSGDRNPIHLNGLAAKAFGFPRAIAHGMYTAARSLAVVGPARGEAFTWTVDFGKPVLLPGTVTFGLRAHRDGRHAYAGWDARSGRVFFAGSVAPLG